METMASIIIVGGGAGGLELATQLGERLGKRQTAKIILVDANLTHLWKPRLHEVASGSMNAHDDELNYLAHARRHHFEFVLGSLAGLDRQQQQIHIAALYNTEGDLIRPELQLPYDQLVIAIGSQSNDFKTAGAAEHCYYLDTRQEAERFHQAWLQRFLAAQGYDGHDATPLHLSIIGAGATGVELAAELTAAAKELAFYGLQPRSQAALSITLIEAADRVLPSLSTRLSKAVHYQLEQLGIKVLTGDKVKVIDADTINLASGKSIPSHLKVWAAGIKAPAVLANLDGLECNHLNQLLVRSTLQTTLDDNIFALGDCACCAQGTEQLPVPPRAQAAHQQAATLAQSLVRQQQGKSLRHFRYHDHGSLISLSRNRALGTLVGKLSKEGMHVEGKVAQVAYRSLYRLHQTALHGRWHTLLIILIDRLRRATRPRLKLH